MRKTICNVAAVGLLIWSLAGSGGGVLPVQSDARQAMEDYRIGYARAIAKCSEKRVQEAYQHLDQETLRLRAKRNKVLANRIENAAYGPEGHEFDQERFTREMLRLSKELE